MRQCHRQLLFAIVLTVAMIPSLSFADGAGRVSRTLKSTTSGCGSCHGSSATSGVVVSISGPDTVAPNQSATYTMTITGGPAVDAGCDISARFGTVSPVSSTIKLSGTELTHKSPIAMIGGTVSIQFSFTAPGAGTSDTLYGTGISTNGSGTGGDQWDWAPKKVITVLSPTDVREEPLVAHGYALQQNYQNPFNPTTQFTFQLPVGVFVSLKVFDVRGSEVASLVDGQMHAGTYTETWNAAGLASGVYYYRLTAGSFVQTRKLLLMK
jgi:hypothetical protein